MNLFEKTSKDKRTLNIITFDAELHVHGKISQYVAEIGKFHFSGVLFLGCDGIFQNCLPKKNIDSNRNSEVCKMCKIKHKHIRTCFFNARIYESKYYREIKLYNTQR